MIVSSPQVVFELLKSRFNIFQEEVWIMSLGGDLRLNHLEMLFRGTLDSTLVHPRDIFRVLLAHQTHSFIVAHNHPSRNLTPSKNDIHLTRQIFELGELMKIPLVDHIIFSDLDFLAFSNRSSFRRWRRTSESRYSEAQTNEASLCLPFEHQR